VKRFDYGVILIERLKQTYTSGEFLDVGRIAEEYSIPAAFLEKIAQDFKKAGVLVAKRGQGGGYKLALEPSQVSMGTLFNFFEWPKRPCPLVRNQKFRFVRN